MAILLFWQKLHSAISTPLPKITLISKAPKKRGGEKHVREAIIWFLLCPVVFGVLIKSFSKGYTFSIFSVLKCLSPVFSYKHSVKHLCSLKNFCEEINVILRFNTLLSRNQQFEANFPPYLFKKERLRDWALNACDVNPVSCSQSCYCRDTGLTS